MKRIAMALMALGLFAGLVPAAHATPVLQGSTVGNAGLSAGCIDAYCTAFLKAGCPAALALGTGATESIVDVSGLGGSKLTWTWSDTTTKLYDAGLGSATPISRMEFYVFGSSDCTTPPLPGSSAPSFGLNTLPAQRSATFTIPNGSKWLIAGPMDNASAVTWTAS